MVVLDEEGNEVYVEPRWFSVAVYSVHRSYGGAEEGGWYYDEGYPVKEPKVVKFAKVFDSRDEAYQYRNKLQEACDIFMNDPKPRRYSDNRFQAKVLEELFPQHFPQEQPRYS